MYAVAKQFEKLNVALAELRQCVQTLYACAYGVGGLGYSGGGHFPVDLLTRLLLFQS
jgi:hypothetical protein